MGGLFFLVGRSTESIGEAPSMKSEIICNLQQNRKRVRTENVAASRPSDPVIVTVVIFSRNISTAIVGRQLTAAPLDFYDAQVRGMARSSIG